MPDRITSRHLEQLVRVINVRVNADPCSDLWQRDADGRLTARLGAFYIDGAYGGVTLYRMVTPGGGVADVLGCGHVPKRDLYNRLQAFYRGLEVAGEE